MKIHTKLYPCINWLQYTPLWDCKAVFFPSIPSMLSRVWQPEGVFWYHCQTSMSLPSGSSDNLCLLGSSYWQQCSPSVWTQWTHSALPGYYSSAWNIKTFLLVCAYNSDEAWMIFLFFFVFAVSLRDDFRCQGLLPLRSCLHSLRSL